MPSRRRRSRTGLGEDPDERPADRRQGRPLRTLRDGRCDNATLPTSVAAEAVTLDEAMALLAARRAAGGAEEVITWTKSRVEDIGFGGSRQERRQESAGRQESVREGSLCQEGGFQEGGFQEDRRRDSGAKKVATRKAG